MLGGTLRLFVAILWLVTSGVDMFEPQPEPKTEEGRIKKYLTLCPWKSLTIERDGKERAYLAKEYWRFDARGVTRWNDGKIVERYDKYILDTKTKPFKLDLVRTEPNGEQFVNATLVTVEGGLIMMRDESGERIEDRSRKTTTTRRPTSFNTKPGDKCVRIFLDVVEDEKEGTPPVESAKK